MVGITDNSGSGGNGPAPAGKPGWGNTGGEGRHLNGEARCGVNRRVKAR